MSCDYIVNGKDGTSHCRLAEDAAQDAAKWRRLKAMVDTKRLDYLINDGNAIHNAIKLAEGPNLALQWAKEIHTPDGYILLMRGGV